MERVSFLSCAFSVLVVPGLAVSLSAGEITMSTAGPAPGATRTLSFPGDRWVGSLYLEPESGPGWDPEGVRLLGSWDYLGAARGEVRGPENRKVKLWMRLELTPRELMRLRAAKPQAYQLLIEDRTRAYAEGLSGLSQLDPNDLFWLTVSSAMYHRTGVNPRVFEPLRRLTGLELLTLASAGITDGGLKHLRGLRGLKGLELTQFGLSQRALAVLKDLPALEYLQLNTGVTDTGLKQVAQISTLRWLHLSERKLWGPGLAELARLPRLERLCFWGSSPITDRHMKYL